MGKREKVLVSMFMRVDLKKRVEQALFDNAAFAGINGLTGIVEKALIELLDRYNIPNDQA